MNRIVLDAKSVELTRRCVPALLHLCEVIQHAVGTIYADEHAKASPFGADLDSLPDVTDHPQSLRYGLDVVLPTITRGNFLMDNTFAGANLIELAASMAGRTAMGVIVLARTSVEASLKASYYLAGTREDRLLNGYALRLADYQEALSADASLASIEAEDSDLAAEYLALRDKAESYGYRLHENKRFGLNRAGKFNIDEVADARGVAVRTNPATTGHAKESGDLWSYHWKYGSGVTHGRIWAIQGEYQRLQRGDTHGDVYLAATAMFMQAGLAYIKALAAFTGVREPAAEGEHLIGGFGQSLIDEGFIPPWPTSSPPKKPNSR